MSQEVVLDTANQLFANTDLTKIFVWNNRYINALFEDTNATYDDVTIPAGTLMGRIGASQLVVPLASGASDGSQFPLGILAEDIVVLASSSYSKNVAICVEGDVDESKVVLDGSDTLDTLISSRSIRDRIGSDTVGVNLVLADQLTGYDNQ